MDGELWDLTDADGVPTGETFRRGDPGFPVGLFHVVASVCVVRGDGLLLVGWVPRLEQLGVRLTEIVGI